MHPYLVRLRDLLPVSRKQADNLSAEVETLKGKYAGSLGLLADLNRRLRLLEGRTITLPDSAKQDPSLSILPIIQAPIPPRPSQMALSVIYIVGDHNAVSLHSNWSKPQPRLQASRDQGLGGLISTIDKYHIEQSKCVLVCLAPFDDKALEIQSTAVDLFRSTVWAFNPEAVICWFMPNNQYVWNTHEKDREYFFSARVTSPGYLDTTEDTADECKHFLEISKCL